MRDIIEQVVDECVNEAIKTFLEEKEKGLNKPPDYEYSQYEASMSKQPNSD